MQLKVAIFKKWLNYYPATALKWGTSRQRSETETASEKTETVDQHLLQEDWNPCRPGVKEMSVVSALVCCPERQETWLTAPPTVGWDLMLLMHWHICSAQFHQGFFHTYSSPFWLYNSKKMSEPLSCYNQHYPFTLSYDRWGSLYC